VEDRIGLLVQEHFETFIERYSIAMRPLLILKYY
jgi:hypothetical protein